MQCPRDNAHLGTEKYEGEVLVDRCPSCDGVWLQRRELEAIQDLRERDYSESLKGIDSVALSYERARQSARTQVECPTCHVELHPEEYAYCSQIIIDRCGKCGGVWLDSGELGALERFFELHTTARPSFFASLWEKFR